MKEKRFKYSWQEDSLHHVWMYLFYRFCYEFDISVTFARQQWTRAQSLLRWPRNVAQVEFSLSSGVHLFNALFLSSESESYSAEN